MFRVRSAGALTVHLTRPGTSAPVRDIPLVPAVAAGKRVLQLINANIIKSTILQIVPQYASFDNHTLFWIPVFVAPRVYVQEVTP